MEKIFPGYTVRKTAQEAANLREQERKEKRRHDDIKSLSAQIQNALAEIENDAGKARSATPGANEDFTYLIFSARDTYELGESPIIAGRIINQSPRNVYLIGRLDGSSSGRRLPIYTARMLDPAGERLEWRGGYCMITNWLRTEDFVNVPAGSAFNPFGPGFSNTTPGIVPRDTPGRYSLRFNYSTDGELHRFMGFGQGNPSDALLKLFRDLPRRNLWSNELILTFRARSEVRSEP